MIDSSLALKMEKPEHFRCYINYRTHDALSQGGYIRSACRRNYSFAKFTRYRPGEDRRILFANRSTRGSYSLGCLALRFATRRLGGCETEVVCQGDTARERPMEKRNAKNAGGDGPTRQICQTGSETSGKHRRRCKPLIRQTLQAYLREIPPFSLPSPAPAILSTHSPPLSSAGPYDRRREKLTHGEHDERIYARTTGNRLLHPPPRRASSDNFIRPRDLSELSRLAARAKRMCFRWKTTTRRGRTAAYVKISTIISRRAGDSRNEGGLSRCRSFANYSLLGASALVDLREGLLTPKRCPLLHSALRKYCTRRRKVELGLGSRFDCASRRELRQPENWWQPASSCITASNSGSGGARLEVASGELFRLHQPKRFRPRNN